MGVVPSIKLLAQLTPAAFEPPGAELPRLHAERHGGEERRCRRFALVIAEPGVTRFHFTVPDRVADAEGGYDLTRLEDVQVDGATARRADHVGDVNRIFADTRHGRL